MKNVLLILIAMALPASAFATSWSASYSYYTAFNFSQSYFGKDVAGVYAHTSVLKLHDSCGNKGVPYWDNAQHVQMDRVGDHFFGKVKLTAGTGECSPRVLGVIVQYWVYLKDGSQTITDSMMVPVSEQQQMNRWPDYDSLIQSMDKNFSELKDANRTEAKMVKGEFVS